MARREKGKKAKKNHGEEEEVDRLSDLPDSVLLHILTFLPGIKCCVRTSVLSKRWNNLWASLPDLIFHRLQSRNAPSFKKLVRHVLSKRENLPVNKFTFRYGEKDKSLITRIIKYAMSHNVQHFGLYVQSASLTCLSSFFSIAPSLKTLELESFHEMHLLEDFTLPSLTTLYLSNCRFWDWEYGETLSIDPFVGLFNLKSLKLLRCSVERVTKFKISGPQLDSLTTTGLGHNDCTVEIFAPKLRFFSLKSFWLEIFSNLDFPLLELAVIDARLLSPSAKGCVESLLDLISMFRWFYNAHSLVLSHKIIQGLTVRPDILEDQSSPFVRLKTLKVKCPAHMMSSFNIPDNVLKYFGENITVQKIKD